jgi:nicotinate phosphoribosyltransferase
MSEFGNVAFDPETLAILEGVFDEAWVSIQAQRNGNITRAALAERILNLAVKGERNPARLLDGALSRSKKDAERDRLERALEEGLRDTFPASDAVSVVQPAPLEPHNDYNSRSKG